MILMPVGDQYQVRRQVIAFPCIGIDVDHIAFGGHDTQASMPLVQEPGLWLFGHSHRTEQH